jgi:hypothetical protein
MLHTISKEQQEIIDALRERKNVIVNSVAGSGKTTSNLHIANTFKDSSILLLTYNAKLKIETREKIEKLKLTNIEIHSYHSFCVRYYDNSCYTDAEIIQLLKSQNGQTHPFSYDIVILDEAQDISPLYFNLICKICKDNECSTPPQIVILGDEKQSIFDFNKADQRFITFADKIFKFNDYPWEKCILSRSFRITHEMSEFINNVMLSNDRIFSQKVSGIKPRYIICNAHGNTSGFNRMFSEIEYYLNLGYLPNEIFILAPSVKHPNSPIRRLENRIKRERPDIPIFVPNGDDAKLDKDILENKMIFSTFHQSKGLERKVVLVSGFDESFFNFYKTKANRSVCPNEFYVATSRALEHMSLFHHYEFDYLPFLDKTRLQKYCEVIKHQELKRTMIKKREITTGVTDLIKHLPQDVLNDCFDLLEIEVINEPDHLLDIEVKTSQITIENGKCLKEEVCEITGIAMQFYVEYLINGDIQTYYELLTNWKDVIKYYNTHNPDKVEEFDFVNMTPQTLLKIANCWNSTERKSGFLFKLQQIIHYDWVSDENLLKCRKRLNQFGFDKNTQIEVNYQNEQESKSHNIKINGFIDFMHNDRIYELKCVSQLKKEHYLQLAVYKYIYEKSTKKYDCKYFLYNILTDELCAIRNNHTTICKMVEFLLEKKYADIRYVSNEVFLFERENTRRLYFERCV